MNFIRKLLGRSPQNSARAGRSSHVTPSRTQRVNMPIRETAPSETPELDALTDDAETSARTSAVEAAPAQSRGKEPLATEREPQAGVDAPRPSGREPQDATARETAKASKEDSKPAASPAPAARRRAFIPQPKPVMARQRRGLAYGIASDVGMARENNEDACFGMQWHSITVDDRPDFGFFVVADGMGGHLDGERASGIAVHTLATEMLARVYVPLLRNFSASDSPTILEALMAASEAANLAVIKTVPGGGTTLSAVAIVGNLAYLVHVGDSRAYLIHGDQIEQLTTDHTLVQRLIEMNELSPQEAENYPQKNVLYRAIGQNENLKMERLIRTLPPAAHVLICSDGLWDCVESDALREITLAAASPQDACDQLVQLANERGGSDNISVIVLRVPGDE